MCWWQVLSYWCHHLGDRFHNPKIFKNNKNHPNCMGKTILSSTSQNCHPIEVNNITWSSTSHPWGTFVEKMTLRSYFCHQPSKTVTNITVININIIQLPTKFLFGRPRLPSVFAIFWPSLKSLDSKEIFKFSRYDIHKLISIY